MKILEFPAKLNIGGAQAVAANIAKYADPSMEFTYVVFGDEVGEYEADIIAGGNRVTHMPEPGDNYLKFFSSILSLMKKERFDVVHAHTMLNCGLIMLAAKIAGVPGRISHSHTTNDESKKTMTRKAYQAAMRMLIRTCATDYCACGVKAGNILYGEKWFSRYGKVIRNGIDVRRFQFDPAVRGEIRRQYGLEDRFVIGHVGHYVTVKNQIFLIRLMEKLQASAPEAVLLLFGDGPDREMLDSEIRARGLQDRVKLMGNVRNISQVLSAFDVFAFPSLYEGTPLALIEAQANGLPCIISDGIPDDACLTAAIRKLSLESPQEAWISAILSGRRSSAEETIAAIDAGYGTIETTMEELYRVFRKYSR